MARENKDMSLNVGTSSVLFIFVILCLVSFAILSLVSAVSDYKLSSNIANNTSSYYEACNEIEDMLSQMDSSLKSLYNTGISRAGYYEQVGKSRSFAYPISSIQTLEVSVNILYPDSANKPFYEINAWHVVTTGSLEYDNSLPVLK